MNRSSFPFAASCLVLMSAVSACRTTSTPKAPPSSPPHSVALRVLHEAGEPLAHARARLRVATREGAELENVLDPLSAWRSTWSTAAPSGRVQIVLPAARAERKLVEVRARGSAPQWIWLAERGDVQPAPRGVLELGDIALARGGRIRGFVHTGGIAARNTWTVRVRGEVLRDGDAVFHAPGASDDIELGRFELVDVGAGEVEIEAVTPGGRYVAGPFVTVTPGEVETVSISLPAGFDSSAPLRPTRASVRVQVTGSPPRDLKLALRDERGEITGEILLEADGWMGPLGAAPGTYSYVFRSLERAWSVTQRAELELAPGCEVLLDFDCVPARATLEIVGEDGAPIAGRRFGVHPARLTVVDRDPTWLRTDGNGRATIELPAGEYELASVPPRNPSTAPSAWPGVLATFDWPPRDASLRVAVRKD